jgi:hypothetical protein
VIRIADERHPTTTISPSHRPTIQPCREALRLLFGTALLCTFGLYVAVQIACCKLQRSNHERHDECLNVQRLGCRLMAESGSCGKGGGGLPLPRMC